MKIAEKYKELLLLQDEINNRLENNDFQHIRELMLWLTGSKSYQMLKAKENQLIMLECFCNIWIEEKKQLEQLGIHEDIFYGVKSLKDVEKKYLTIKYCGLRLENAVPGEYCEQAIDELIDYRVSGIAMAKVFAAETYKGKENIVQMAQWLKIKQQLVTAITLLQYGLKVYEGNKDMLLELADCWLEGQQWQSAYDCLKQIKKPDATVKELMGELEQVI